jgi:CheY-like chemotaxis protein
MVAEASAAGKPFSIVLMDVQMPHVDGLEATRRIRAAGFDAAALPIVALTANAYAEDVAVCLDAGMQAHLCKPVLLEDLGAMLNRWGAQPALAPAVAGHGPTLDERYRNRKQETLARLEALAGGDQDAAAVSTVADLLHKLAGTAAMFGEAELGDIARQLEHDLGEWPEVERSQRVRAVLPALRAAA